MSHIGLPYLYNETLKWGFPASQPFSRGSFASKPSAAEFMLHVRQLPETNTQICQIYHFLLLMMKLKVGFLTACCLLCFKGDKHGEEQKMNPNLSNSRAPSLEDDDASEVQLSPTHCLLKFSFLWSRHLRGISWIWHIYGFPLWMMTLPLLFPPPQPTAS